MTLCEAIRTGHKFKRPHDTDWRALKPENNVMSLEDLSATDYITEKTVLKTELTISQLEAHLVVINQDSPIMSRGLFREWVETLTGVKIK